MQKSSGRWLLPLLFTALFLFSYWNQLLYHYEVPPGGDAFGHLEVVKNILNGDFSQIIHYHTVWHVIVATLTLLLHLPSITVMAWLGPLLLVTMGASLYFFNSRTFGTMAGVSAMILIGFLSQQPLQTLYDGGFPNVLAAGTILPIVFLQVNKLFDVTVKQKFKAICLFILWLIILIYSHHITTIYALVILFLFLFIEILIYLHKRNVSPFLILLGLLGLIFLGLLTLVFFLNSPFTGSVKSLLTQFVIADFHFPFLHLIGKLNDPNAMWSLSEYVDGIGMAVVYLGLAGYVFALFHVFLPIESSQRRILTLLLLWSSILFIGSRVSALGFPVRLARDLAIPLALLGGYFIGWVVTYCTHRRIPVFFTLLFLFTCLSLGWITAKSRWQQARNPNPLVSHLSVDTQAGNYIARYIDQSAKVAAFQDDIYINEFSKPHKVILLHNSPDKIQLLSDVRTAAPALQDIDYLYLERRRDRESGWLNNDDYIKSYKEAAFSTLVEEFSQREKSVYLFKIIHPKQKAKNSLPSEKEISPR